MVDTVVLNALEDSTEEEESADDVSALYPVRADPTKNEKEDVQESSNFQPRKRARKNIVSPEMAATLDRTELSDRKATSMFAPTARSLGNDIKDYHHRLCLRQDIFNLLKDKFGPGTQLTIHWGWNRYQTSQERNF